MNCYESIRDVRRIYMVDICGVNIRLLLLLHSTTEGQMSQYGANCNDQCGVCERLIAMRYQIGFGSTLES